MASGSRWKGKGGSTIRRIPTRWSAPGCAGLRSAEPFVRRGAEGRRAYPGEAP